jgi:hypothetical protein
MSSFYATMSRSFLALAIFTASVAFCGRAQAQPQEPDLKLRVDGDEGSPTGDGSGWGTAFKFLQDAIAVALAEIQDPNPPEINTVWIWVAKTEEDNPYRPDQGADNPDGTRDRHATVRLYNGISLYGGFLGLDHPSLPNGETELSQRNPEINETILSGYQPAVGTPPDCGDPAAGSCYEANGTPECDDPWCCALICAEPGLEICCLTGWIQGCADAAAERCPGDAYHVLSGAGLVETARLDGFTITGGHADGSDENAFGGGFLLTQGSLSTLGHPVIVRCRITGNSAINGGGYAGLGDAVGQGLYPTMIDCVFTGNEAVVDGGGVYSGVKSGGTYTNCLFADNEAGNDGGGMLIVGNKDHQLINCTMADNTAAGDGGGVFVDQVTNGPAVVTLDNAILWSNKDGGPPDESAQLFVLEGTGGLVLLSFSDIDGSGLPAGVTDGGGNIHVDPQFDDAVGGNYRLGKLCSRCIDRADNDPVPPDEYDVNNDTNVTEDTPDLDVLQRIRDGLQVPGGSAIVDMGAYEFVPPPCPWDCQKSPNGAVGVVDFLELLAQWGQECTSCDFGVGAAGVGVEDFLAFLGHWGPCGVSGGTPPQSVQDCIDRFGLEDPQILQACICAIDPCEEGCPPEECK